MFHPEILQVLHRLLIVPLILCWSNQSVLCNCRRNNVFVNGFITFPLKIVNDMPTQG